MFDYLEPDLCVGTTYFRIDRKLKHKTQHNLEDCIYTHNLHTPTPAQILEPEADNLHILIFGLGRKNWA